MAEILKPDKDQKEKEAAIEVRSSQENEKRLEYLQLLKHDELFQRFVIRELLDPEIERLTDIRNIPLDGDQASVIQILTTSKAARAVLEKFRSKLVL